MRKCYHRAADNFPGRVHDFVFTVGPDTEVRITSPDAVTALKFLVSELILVFIASNTSKQVVARDSVRQSKQKDVSTAAKVRHGSRLFLNIMD